MKLVFVTFMYSTQASFVSGTAWSEEFIEMGLAYVPESMKHNIATRASEHAKTAIEAGAKTRADTLGTFQAVTRCGACVRSEECRKIRSFERVICKDSCCSIVCVRSRGHVRWDGHCPTKVRALPRNHTLVFVRIR